ncbi:MAG: DUF4115 domain-containing protein [Chlorobi bacterium]|nr:DUF4115 domain-containing protein [Chlorobiota bacterium]
MINEELKELSGLLKAEREAKKITLKEISDSSRINIKFLEAIENGDFDVMEEVYIRAFLKTYAKYVGLNPEKVLTDFELAKKNKLGRTTETPLPIAVANGEKERAEKSFAEDDEKEKKKKGVAMFVALAALVVIALAIIFFLPKEEENIPQETSFEEILKEKKVESPPITTPKKTVEQKEGVSVRIDANGKCWIGVRADADTTSSQYMLSEGSKKFFTASDSMRIVFGNPAGVKVFFNNKELNVAKKKGEVTEVIFHKEGAKISVIKFNKNE